MKHVYDRLDSDTRAKFEGSKKAIMEALDEDPGEYLIRFNEATKKSNETYSAFCIRLISLYLRGQGENNNYELKTRDQISLVHGFLQGIDQSHAASLRLVASDDELADVQLLARRAQKLNRSRGRSLPPIIKEEKSAVNNTQTVPTDSISKRLAKIEEQMEKLIFQKDRIQRYAKNPNRDMKGRSKKDDECRKCGKKGHWERDCYSKGSKDDKDKSSKYCSYCKKSNHTIENCWSRKNKEKTIANILGEREERRIRMETSENDKNQQPQIDVLVKDPETNESKAVKALADSGSSLTCANSKLEFFRNRNISRSVVRPVTANGAKIRVAGQCIVDMKVGGMLIQGVTVILMDDLQYDMILGSNLLLAVGFKIHKGGKLMDIGQEENLPVYGVNQLRENEYCNYITYDDHSLSLNSLTATDRNLNNACPKNTHDIPRIPSRMHTINSILINEMTCCSIREKQELCGMRTTENSEKQNTKASEEVKYITLRDDQTDVIEDEKKRLQDLIGDFKDVFSKSEYDIGKFIGKDGKSDL